MESPGLYSYSSFAILPTLHTSDAALSHSLIYPFVHSINLQSQTCANTFEKHTIQGEIERGNSHCVPE